MKSTTLVVLPEVEVCNSYLPGRAPTGAGCCGGPAPDASAGCVADALTKEARVTGCGCR
jgi:hypothetical protein